MQSADPMNLLVVITDDQGYGDLSCHGNPVLRTPNLDRLRREGCRFTEFHCGPTSAPTRASLLTGHHANSTGVWHTIGGRSLLRKDEWTLAQALKESGYRTGLFGKWHLGDNVPFRPQDRGFDEALYHGGGGISQTPDYWGNDYFDDTYFRNGRPEAFTGYCTEVWFTEAMRFMGGRAGEPFLCWLAPNAPHWPYNIDRRWWQAHAASEPEPRARFYGMIEHLDAWMGRLLEFLGESRLDRNTIVVFMTDNGTSCGAAVDSGHHVTNGYNAGLRGIKGSPYDGGHKVPLFIRDPRLNRDVEVDRIAGCTDLMPTILDLLDIAPPPGRSFHGTSLRPLMQDPACAWPGRFVVTDSQRVPEPVKWRQSCVMSQRWRLVNGTELYDNQDDPSQRRDVAAHHPGVVAAHRSAYEDWWALVSGRFDEPVPIEVGGETSRGILLTAHDWRNGKDLVPWHQGHIRQGMQDSGCWEIDVQASGEYEISLHRWPPESRIGPAEPLPEQDDPAWHPEGIALEDHWIYRGGCRLPITGFQIHLNGAILVRVDGATGFCARVHLPGGIARLGAEFILAGGATIGAYYTRISARSIANGKCQDR